MSEILISEVKPASLCFTLPAASSATETGISFCCTALSAARAVFAEIAAAIAAEKLPDIDAPDIDAPAAGDTIVSADAVVSDWVSRHTDPRPESVTPLDCSILRALYRTDRYVAELEEEARRIRARHEAAAKIASLLSEEVGGDMDEADEVLRCVAEIIGDVQ